MSRSGRPLSSMRIKGAGSEFCDLLEAAGVDSPAERAQRNAANPAQTFQELDAARNTRRRIPGETEVVGWIEQAEKMDKVIEHWRSLPERPMRPPPSRAAAVPTLSS